jgi:ureidoglycolate amidohydrolase
MDHVMSFTPTGHCCLLRFAANLGLWAQVKLRIDYITRDNPATCAAATQSAAQAAAAYLGPLKAQALVSHAYHDSLFMAQVAPTGMLFIPCFKGYSHRPDEFATGPAMAKGVRALALMLAELAQHDVLDSGQHEEL